jgi:hypothetical protein
LSNNSSSSSWSSVSPSSRSCMNVKSVKLEDMFKGVTE